MMLVRILRDKTTRSGRIFRVGTIMELADGAANVLIRRKIAEPLGMAAAKRQPAKRQRSEN